MPNQIINGQMINDRMINHTTNHARAWFVLLGSHHTDPFWPCPMSCYVKATSCSTAREIALGYFAGHPTITEHFKRPIHSITKRLRLCIRCPDMDAVAGADPAINHDRAVMLGLSALSIVQNGDKAELVWQPHRSRAEARHAERALLEALFDHIPNAALLTAIKAIAAKTAKDAKKDNIS